MKNRIQQKNGLRRAEKRKEYKTTGIGLKIEFERFFNAFKGVYSEGLGADFKWIRMIGGNDA